MPITEKILDVIIAEPMFNKFESIICIVKQHLHSTILCSIEYSSILL